ncbi:MAG: peptidase U62 modulator of DNA gyrase [Clostridiales bacterium 38_11]|nr:MAG: peptidase U62 modulator of DNA gyrase [Clostridiales bacterium 38_11]
MKGKMLKTMAMLKEKGVEYADVRINDIVTESISTENMKTQMMYTGRTKGYGIRVFLDGSMGFAASQDFDDMDAIANEALRIAKASKIAQIAPVKLAKKDTVVDNYLTHVEIDPFTVSKKDKLDLLFAAEKAMREAVPELFKTVGNMDFRKEEKWFMDSDGSDIRQVLYESGSGIEAIAVGNGDIQQRTFPNSFRGNFATAGYEFVKNMGLVENAPRVAREAAALISADECPSGFYDLVIDGDQMTLQIHESIGHPIELDRVLGYEAGYAGTSFLNPEMTGFQYGSEHINIVADATVPKGLGTFGYDDEGVKAQRVPIITKGIFQNFISSRDTASILDQASNGTSRADSWGRIPIVRMTNINLLPGTFELDELIAGVEDGLYLSANKSWSIDDKRLNFQFGCEIAYEIKNGKLTGKIYKNPIYSGITPKFWNACDGVASEKYWKMFGTPNCGKGEPGQTAHVGHGSSPSRFRKIKVGVTDVK